MPVSSEPLLDSRSVQIADCRTTETMGDTALQPGPRARGYPYMTKVNNRASVVVKEQVGINLIVGHGDLLRPLDLSLDELLEFGQQREQEFARLAAFWSGPRPSATSRTRTSLTRSDSSSLRIRHPVRYAARTTGRAYSGRCCRSRSIFGLLKETRTGVVSRQHFDVRSFR